MQITMQKLFSVESESIDTMLSLRGGICLEEYLGTTEYCAVAMVFRDRLQDETVTVGPSWDHT